ncbi:MAG: hypothetical protein K8R02_04890 [Anaerohalosphaeraceae bacterium]|nr:hypothetical protein [Anaerohalosphaeraceae bacterium]
MKIMEIIRTIKRRLKGRGDLDSLGRCQVKWYPSNRSCVKADMNNSTPSQMPPLMVRKAAWRR